MGWPHFERPGHVSFRPLLLRTSRTECVGYHTLRGSERGGRKTQLCWNYRGIRQGRNCRVNTLVRQVPQVVWGKLRVGTDVNYPQRDGTTLALARIDADDLAPSRSMPAPAADLSTRQVLDFLEETGRRLNLDTNPYLAE